MYFTEELSRTMPCLATTISVSTNNHLCIKLIKLKKATQKIQGPKSLMCPQMKIYDIHKS